MFVRPAVPLVLSMVAASCVPFTPDHADASTVAAEASQRTGGHFTFQEAVATALRQNAELLALAARARAAGAATPATEAEAEWRSDTDMLAVLVDPVALLGLGARGAEADVTARDGEAALLELTTGRWRVIAAIAEAFAVDAALAALAPPRIAIDPAAFEAAGLASPIAAQQVQAAQARAEAEVRERQAAAAVNLAGLRRLLGLPAGAEVACVPGTTEIVRQPAAGEAALLARPDLAVAAARWRVADSEFRRAVAAQYPSLMIGPDIPLVGGTVGTMAVLRLPLGANGQATAALERRQAARADLAEAYLRASAEAASAEAELAAATANEFAATSGARASTAALATALTSVQVEVDAFDRVVDAAAMTVRDAMEQRTAAMGLARARIRRAVAFGWPLALGES